MMNWVEEHAFAAGLGITVAIVAVALLIVWLSGGFKAEPSYATFCDNSGGSHGNRIYIPSGGGGIAVVPADRSCG